MRGSGGKLSFIDKKRDKVWKDNMKSIDWYHDMYGYAVESPVRQHV